MQDNIQDVGPQGGFFIPVPPPVTGMQLFFKVLFNIKTIGLITIASLAFTVYVQQNKIDSYKLQLDNQIAKTELVDRDLTYCRSNFEQLQETVESAAVESKKLNEEFFGLRTEIEKFNKINRNNSKQIDDIRNSALASTCDDAIKELAAAIEGDK